jgi:hypothetical protein
MERYIEEYEAETELKFGFIAQELREIYPNLVLEDDYGHLSLNYIGLIPVLVESIKELNTKINVLEGKDISKNTMNFGSGAVLYQNNPNPFNEQTEIKYFIPSDASSASICIYDMTGKEITKYEIRDRNNGSITINANRLQAGMYMYTLLVDGREVSTHRMILTGK